jgi:hypothetical protein
MRIRNFSFWMAFALALGPCSWFAATSTAAVKTVSTAIDADTMIAIDTNSTALPPPVGSNSTGAFGTGLEQANPLNGLPLTIRGGNPFDPSSLTAKPLIRFNLGPAANLAIDPNLPYFLEITTQTDANSNDTFRFYSITDPATRSFNEATLTWDNAPPAATASFQDFEAAGHEAGIFFRATSIDVAGTSVAHPLMGSQISTFVQGANAFATFGLTSTETNRWVTTDQSSPKPPRLITYDVTESVANGSLTSGGTWAGAANVADTLYRVGSGHQVTVDGAQSFAGKGVVVGIGGAALTADFDGSGAVDAADLARWQGDFGINGDSDADGDGDSDGADFLAWQRDLGAAGSLSNLVFTANNVHLPLIVINGDGQFVNNTGTSLSIGDPSLTPDEVHAGGASGATINGTAGGLLLNRDVTYAAAVGEENLSINIPLISYRDFTFQGVASSHLNLRFPAGHRGTIRFDGAGDEVVLLDDEGIGGQLVMNSSGANSLVFAGFDSEQEFDKGTVVFEQAGRVVHRSDTDGLQGMANLVVNAPLTIDLSQTFPVAGPQSDERTLRVTRNLSGAAPLTVLGTAVAPTGTGNTANQFQIGVNAADFTDVREVDYSGTLSTDGFVQVETRAAMPAARIVVNRNGVLATGFEPHAKVPHQQESTTRIGEIQLAAESAAGAGDGGQLHVGFLVATTGNGDHGPQNLRLTTSGGQNGNLTLANGTSLVMQLNGEPDHVRPQPGDPGNCVNPLESSCQYDGLVFDTIEVEGVATLDGELVVRLNADIPFQVEPSGTPPADPDYFPIAVGDTWDLISGVNGGTITGTFDTVRVIDTLNDLSATQTFEVLYTSPTLVQLRLVDTAALPAVAVVPEPASGIVAMGLLGAVCASRRVRAPFSYS